MSDATANRAVDAVGLHELPHRGGNSIVAYKVGRNGLLAPTRLRTKVGSPAWIVFFLS